MAMSVNRSEVAGPIVDTDGDGVMQPASTWLTEPSNVQSIVYRKVNDAARLYPRTIASKLPVLICALFLRPIVIPSELCPNVLTQQLRDRASGANAIRERFVGSLRQVCLDHVLVIGGLQLIRILNEYGTYFNQARPHQGIT